MLRVLLPLSAGIALKDAVIEHFDIHYVIAITLGLAGAMAVFYRMARRKSQVFNTFFGVSVILFILLSGVVLSSISIQKPVEGLDQKEVVVSGTVISDMVEKDKVYSVSISVENCFTVDSCYAGSQNLVVYITKDSLLTMCTPGETWLFRGEMSAIRNRGNPGEFDYKSYMARRGYYYTLYVGDISNAKILDNRSIRIKYLPLRIRQKIMSGWDHEDEDIAVLSALTLGNKTLLDRETKRSYAYAGGMHLLAVSGLHVGMVWWILDILIRVPASRKFWRSIKLLLILAILWFYAGITGLSDSVTRSVTMFSLVAFSKSVDRNSNIFNTLFLSAFILLLLKPSRQMEPGFQLSYLAVFGIITIQPLFISICNRKSKILKYFLELVSVSIAAQLATLPLSLLYFNQFPVWFLLTNIVAIPLVSIILALFVLFSPFLIFRPDIEVFTSVLWQLVHLLNTLITKISALPFSVISEIAISPTSALLIFLIEISLIALFYYRRFHYLICSLLLLLLIMIYSSYDKNRMSDNKVVQVYNFNHTTVLSYLNRGERASYVLNHSENPEPYLDEFLSSLKRIPGRIPVNRIIDLNSANLHPQHGVVKLSPGIWALKMSNINLLMAGKCKPEELELALSMHEWSFVLIMHGFPLNSNLKDKVDEDTQLIGDGSLNSYEVAALKKMDARAYIIESSGPFSFYPE